MTRNLPFYKSGGITVSGGEPLMQMDFLTELFELAKAQGIHTCLDTSGITFNPESEESRRSFARLAGLTDLFMLDIKHMDTAKHRELTGRGNENVLALAEYLDSLGAKIRIRHVILPGYTDGEEELRSLGRYLRKIKHLESVETLPYHDLGKAKYENMGIPYPLAHLSPLTRADADRAKSVILSEMDIPQ